MKQYCVRHCSRYIIVIITCEARALAAIIRSRTGATLKCSNNLGDSTGYRGPSTPFLRITE